MRRRLSARDIHCYVCRHSSGWRLFFLDSGGAGCIMTITMRKLMICAALLSGLLLNQVGSAQGTDAETGVRTDALSPVAAALSELKPVCGTLNKEADYYIYLYSASWCGPCRAVMPRIVSLYKDSISKNKRVEIVLFDFDRSEEEARRYVGHYGANFCTVMGENPLVDKLPGAYQVRGIPHCIAVDKNGKRIFSGHASVIFSKLDLLN